MFMVESTRLNASVLQKSCDPHRKIYEAGMIVILQKANERSGRQNIRSLDCKPKSFGLQSAPSFCSYHTLYLCNPKRSELQTLRLGSRV